MYALSKDTVYSSGGGAKVLRWMHALTWRINRNALHDRHCNCTMWLMFL